MAKLNIWFARGYSARVKTVDLPPFVKAAGEDITDKAFFKNDYNRYQAYLKGWHLANALFFWSKDPDHKSVVGIETEAWKDARKHPKLYPIVLFCGSVFLATEDLPGRLLAPYFD